MGFKDEKAKVLECLEKGNYEHDLERENINTQNLFAIGVMSKDEVHDIINHAKGVNYSTAPHHLKSLGINVHIISYYDIRHKCNWYIKWYYIDPNTFFISVHS